MARWLVKILKTLINTRKSGIVYCMECGKYVGLTLTWDVLKLFYNIEELRHIKINFNMGCIETKIYLAINRKRKMITLTKESLEKYKFLKIKKKY